MIGIAFAALHDRPTRTAAFSAERTRKIEDAAQDAQDRIKEEGEEWEHADIDEGDGGVPTSIPKPDVPAPVYHGSYRAAGNTNRGGHKSVSNGQAPKLNAAARKAMAEREAKKAQFKAEVSAAATGEMGWNYFDGPPPKKENPKQAPQDGGVKLGAGAAAGSEKKAFSVDDLAPRFKNRLAMIDAPDDADEGGVRL
jgi:hypothetical protein